MGEKPLAREISWASDGVKSRGESALAGRGEGGRGQGESSQVAAHAHGGAPGVIPIGSVPRVKGPCENPATGHLHT